MSNLTSRFFTIEDDAMIQLDDFTIPQEWWSRPFEYQWASKFLKREHVILDAGCGIAHPFKFFASKKVGHVIAVDNDTAIMGLEPVDNIEFVNADISDLNGKVEDESIDTVFCISVLEHMYPQNALDALKEFKRVVKPDGQVILTMDHPYLPTETFINLVNEAGLQFAGTVDFEIDKHKVIKGPYNNMKCFRAVLVKDDAENNTDDAEKPGPKERKPRKPKETK